MTFMKYKNPKKEEVLIPPFNKTYDESPVRHSHKMDPSFTDSGTLSKTKGVQFYVCNDLLNSRFFVANW